MNVFRGILDLLFPPKCMFCQKVLSGNRRLCCPDCETKYASDSALRVGVFFRACYVPLLYSEGVREAIIRFKFKDNTGYATEFGKILAGCINANLKGQYDLITWIPVSEKRFRQRGYDQAMLLAMAAALELGDVAVETLRKAVDTPAQSSLEGAEARKSNVLGAYQVPDPEIISGKRILLMDDVITTGATLEEASRTLRNSGARDVVAVALAQPPEQT